MGSGAAKKASLPPQQHDLERRHHARGRRPTQPSQPPGRGSLRRLRQQARRVSDDRDDHDGDHVPEVKGHHVVVRDGQHPLDEAGAQHAVQRGRERHHQSGLRACEGQHRHSGRRRVLHRCPGTPIMLTGYRASQISSASATPEPTASSTGRRPANSPQYQVIPSW